MKKSDLCREWARVLDMCEGTKANPIFCWKFNSVLQSCDPNFSGRLDCYEFAVAILEDKPVFVGDKLWLAGNSNGHWITVESDLYINSDAMSWNPPKKATFTWGSYEDLPCPVSGLEGRYPLTLNGKSFWFLTEEDRNTAGSAISDILRDATK